MKNNLQVFRQNKAMTLKEVADELGVSESLVSLFESGKRKPNIRKISKYAEILGVSIQDIVACFDLLKQE